MEPLEQRELQEQQERPEPLAQQVPPVPERLFPLLPVFPSL